MLVDLLVEIPSLKYLAAQTAIKHKINVCNLISLILSLSIPFYSLLLLFYLFFTPLRPLIYVQMKDLPKDLKWMLQVELLPSSFESTFVFSSLLLSSPLISSPLFSSLLLSPLLFYSLLFSLY